MKKTCLWALLLAATAYAQPVRDGKIVCNSTAGEGSTAIKVIEGDQNRTVRQEKGNIMLDPSWAPGGGIFYMSADRAGQSGSLCWMNEAGLETKVVIPFAKAVGFQPIPSPDGKHLVFYVVATEKGEDLPQLWLADGDGSNAHAFGPKGACFPAWSPDSQQLLAVVGVDDKAKRAQLVAYDLEGRALRTVYTSEDTFVTPAWSPDGRTIVISRMASGGKLSHLYSIDSEGNNLKQLTNGEDGAEMSACFDAQGRLYYNRLTKAGISLWSCDADGQNAKKISDNAAIHGGASLMWLTTR